MLACSCKPTFMSILFSRHLCRVAALILGLVSSSNLLAQGSGNLPPVAAPTSRVKVDPIPTVRSGVERAGDFVAGLLRGLRSDPRIQGIAAVIVRDGDPALERFSGSLVPDIPFAAGGIERAIYSFAVARLIEAGRLQPSQDVGTLVDGSASGVVVGRLLADDESADTATLARVVEKGSGQTIDTYLAAEFFRPLGMGASRLENGVLVTSLHDLERFAVMLADGQSVRAVQDARGKAFGLAPMQRNGWHALQLDGRAAGFATRFVFAPGAKMVYLLSIRGRADAQTWRDFDDAVFDEFLPPNPGALQSASNAKNGTGAKITYGTYEPDPQYRSLAFLKSSGRELNLRAGKDGSLVLSGAENATLAPVSTGEWSNPDGAVAASYRDSELFLSSGLAYRPVAFYKRPAVYALIALVTTVATIGAMLLAAMPGPWTWLGGPFRRGNSTDRSRQQERSA